MSLLTEVSMTKPQSVASYLFFQNGKFEINYTSSRDV
jgi:hypothetical protein